MQRLGRISIGCMVGAVSLSLIGVASASAPKHATSLTKGNSAVADAINVVAGSSSAVVYETGPSWKRGPSGKVSLDAANAKGKVRHLATPKGQDVSNLRSWSMVGNELVALEADGLSVAWWNVAGSKHGTKALPTGFTLLGASTNGWVIGDSTTGGVYNVKPSGKPQKLGAPFLKSAEKGFQFAVSGTTGIAIVGSAGGVAYLRWGSKKFTALKFSTLKDPLSGCSSLAGGAVGCYGFQTTTYYIYRIPLKGKKTVATKVATKVGSPSNVAVSASATTWTTSENQHLYGTKAKGGKVKTSKHVSLPAGYIYRGTAAAAFGKVAVVTGSVRKLKLATVSSATSKAKGVVNAALGAIHAGSIALGTNRVAYSDDQKDFNAGDVWSRSLSGKANVGSASELISGSATSFGLSISGTTTADSEIVSVGKTKFKQVVAVVVGKKKSNVTGSAGEASGASVLYTSPKGKEMIYNAKKKKSAALSLPVGYQAVYLNGSTVDYVEADGSVWARGIPASSTPFMLSGPTASAPSFSSISASGKDIAWSRYVAGVSTVNYCVIAGGACPVKSAGSTDTLVAATTDGVLLYHEADNSTTVTITWDLHSYSGSTKKVLSQTYSFAQFGGASIGNSLYSQVAISKGRIAWIDPGGSAHLAKL